MKTETAIPIQAQTLLTKQKEIDSKLTELSNIINSVERGAMGITLESAKTPEWHKAKQ